MRETPQEMWGRSRGVSGAFQRRTPLVIKEFRVFQDFRELQRRSRGFQGVTGGFRALKDVSGDSRSVSEMFQEVQRGFREFL